MAMPVKRRVAAEAPASPDPSQPVPTVSGEVVAKPGDAAPPARRSRGASTRWVPGQSGNPLGRRKQDPKIVALLKDKSLAAAQTLVEIMEDPDVHPRVRCQAAEVILDRVYGKAVQPIDAMIEGEMRQVQIMFVGELEKWAK